jgi:uncharacterized membrane protein YqjE
MDWKNFIKQTKYSWISPVFVINLLILLEIIWDSDRQDAMSKILGVIIGLIAMYWTLTISQKISEAEDENIKLRLEIDSLKRKLQERDNKA